MGSGAVGIRIYGPGGKGSEESDTIWVRKTHDAIFTIHPPIEKTVYRVSLLLVFAKAERRNHVTEKDAKNAFCLLQNEFALGWEVKDRD